MEKHEVPKNMHEALERLSKDTDTFRDKMITIYFSSIHTVEKGLSLIVDDIIVMGYGGEEIEQSKKI